MYNYFEIVHGIYQGLSGYNILKIYHSYGVYISQLIRLEHLAMLLTSTLAINCYLRNFLNKAIGTINFAKPFLNFIDDTMI